MNLNNSANTYFEIALAKPTVAERCHELTKLIDDYGTKVLHNNFQSIVHHIFGVNCIGWGVLSANPRYQASDFKAMKEFLGCRGAMFRLLQKLQNESMLFRYDFPCSMLPPTFVHFPGEHPTTVSRIHPSSPNTTHLGSSLFSPAQNLSMPSAQACLRVSAFEYYFYHFASCIVRLPSNYHVPTQLLYHQLPPSVDENLYYLLVDEYLFYFLPLDIASLQTMHIPTTHTPVGASLLNPVNSLLRRTNVKSTPLGSSKNEIWRSDLLVHILVEFWLGYCVIRRDYKHLTSPSEDLIRAVRLLVKHIHYFDNATSSSLNRSHLNDSSLDIFKQNILYNSLQPRLFNFLCYCFKVWPLNSSFRVVLETWLSYIQPWRYLDLNNTSKTAEMRLNADREIANVWYHFISSNLHFYTQLFQNAINRFLRMDISKQSNSLLLYRVAKIFYQPNLFNMIEEAEIAMYGTERPIVSDVPTGSFVSFSHHDVSAQHSCLITSGEMRRTVNQLLIVCKQALGTVKRYTTPRNVDLSTRILTVIGLGALTDVSGDQALKSSWKKSMQQIEESMEMLASLFDLSLDELDSSMRDRNDSENPFGPEAADIAFTEEGKAVLSDLGRYEVANNMKKLPVYPNANPELQPIRTFENAFLVRFLHRVSTAVNLKYGQNLENLCAQPNFVGSLAKAYLKPTYDDSPSIDVKDWQTRKAYFSLRLFAHYRTLFYIVLYFMLCRLFGLSYWRAIFMVLLFVVIFAVLKALIMDYVSD